jgi:putative transposase
MVEKMLAAHGITVSYETVRQWGRKFGPALATRLRRWTPRRGDKWHLDEVVLTIASKKQYLWRAVDQGGFMLDALVQSRHDTKAVKRFLRKLLKQQGRAPRVLVTDKLKSYAAAKRKPGRTITRPPMAPSPNPVFVPHHSQHVDVTLSPLSPRHHDTIQPNRR